MALKEWLLLGVWDRLALATLNAFKMKIRKIARKCWPQSLPKNGNLSWLYYNHWIYSGNVPLWADWKWPRRKDIDSFKTQFYCLLTGQHSAGGNKAKCSSVLCKSDNEGPVLNHHYSECVSNYYRNCDFFKSRVRGMYEEYLAEGNKEIPPNIVDRLLERPSGMWVGLMDPNLVDVGLKLRSIHAVHRIFTIASVLSWGRFYHVSL